MAPVLGAAMLVVARGSADFRTLFKELIKDDFTQSELAMIQFIHSKVLFAPWPSSLFSFIVI